MIYANDMCQCTPNIRAPFCGKPGCERPRQNNNATKLASFVAYCQEHPEERFWQALKNWAEVSYVYTQTEHSPIEDTYYKE